MIMGYGTMLVLGWMNVAYIGTTVLASDNEAIEEPACDNSKAVNVRFSATSKRLYLESTDGYEGGGCVTLGQIFEARDEKAPLFAVNPSTGERVENATGTWLLTQSLYVEDGITLNVSPRYVDTNPVCGVHADYLFCMSIWALFVAAHSASQLPGLSVVLLPQLVF